MAETGQVRPPDIHRNVQAPPLHDGRRVEATHTKNPTFAAVTKAKTERRFPTIQLAACQYGNKDGKPSIAFTSAELQVGIDYLKYSLVAKFSSGRPPIDEVRRAFMESWALTGPCSIGAWDARHILIVLESEMDARKVLSHPIRKLGHSFFRVFRWSSEFDTKHEPTYTTTWVRLSNLPPHMFNPGYIEAIFMSFGRYLAVDNKTVFLNNPSFARICIEVDISTNLPDEVWISTGVETGFWLKLSYETRMQYCTKCRLHGHQLETCRKTKQSREAEMKIWEARDDHGLSIGKPKSAMPQTLQNKDNTNQSMDKRAPLTFAENGDQSWQLVQNRKQKQKAFKQSRNKPATQTDKQQKSCSAKVSHETSDKSPASSSMPETLTHPDKMDKSTLVCAHDEGNLDTIGLQNLKALDLDDPQMDYPRAHQSVVSNLAGQQLNLSCENTNNMHPPAADNSDNPEEVQGNSEDIAAIGQHQNKLGDLQNLSDLVGTISDDGNNGNAEITGTNNNTPHGDQPRPALDHAEKLTTPALPPEDSTMLTGSCVVINMQSNEELHSTEVPLSEETVQKISSYGSSTFCSDECDGPIEARAFYLQFKANYVDDALIFQAMDEAFNAAMQAQKEDSDNPIDESESSVDLSLILKKPRQKKKESRSSGRSRPKKKDTNFVW